MNNIFMRFLSVPVLLAAVCCKAPGGNEITTILMKTTLGDIKIKLYNDTPFHRDNFVKLINEGIYDGVTFHRVINGFMIQSGDLSTSSVKISQAADSLNTFTLPAEFNRKYFHKKGALAAARQGNDVNPDMRSSGTQFYIVQGTRLTAQELDQSEQSINNNLKQSMFNKYLKQLTDSARISRVSLTDGEIQEKAAAKMFNYLTSHDNFKISEDQRVIYKDLGGVPRLDGTYTVFGEVIEGLEVVDMIAAVPTNTSDKPLQDIRIIKMKIVSH